MSGADSSCSTGASRAHCVCKSCGDTSLSMLAKSLARSSSSGTACGNVRVCVCVCVRVCVRARPIKQACMRAMAAMRCQDEVTRWQLLRPM